MADYCCARVILLLREFCFGTRASVCKQTVQLANGLLKAFSSFISFQRLARHSHKTLSLTHVAQIRAHAAKSGMVMAVVGAANILHTIL
jgi:hypothetical protein